jgi:hypothetical protein
VVDGALGARVRDRRVVRRNRRGGVGGARADRPLHGEIDEIKLKLFVEGKKEENKQSKSQSTLIEAAVNVNFAVLAVAANHDAPN